MSSSTRRLVHGLVVDSLIARLQGVRFAVAKTADRVVVVEFVHDRYRRAAARRADDTPDDGADDCTDRSGERAGDSARDPRPAIPPSSAPFLASLLGSLSIPC